MAGKAHELQIYVGPGCLAGPGPMPFIPPRRASWLASTTTGPRRCCVFAQRGLERPPPCVADQLGGWCVQGPKDGADQPASVSGAMGHAHVLHSAGK
jgi:hypothetical protein